MTTENSSASLYEFPTKIPLWSEQFKIALHSRVMHLQKAVSVLAEDCDPDSGSMSLFTPPLVLNKAEGEIYVPTYLVDAIEALIAFTNTDQPK